MWRRSDRRHGDSSRPWAGRVRSRTSPTSQHGGPLERVGARPAVQQGSALAEDRRRDFASDATALTVLFGTGTRRLISALEPGEARASRDERENGADQQQQRLGPAAGQLEQDGTDRGARGHPTNRATASMPAAPESAPAARADSRAVVGRPEQTESADAAKPGAPDDVEGACIGGATSEPHQPDSEQRHADAAERPGGDPCRKAARRRARRKLRPTGQGVIRRPVQSGRDAAPIRNRRAAPERDGIGRESADRGANRQREDRDPQQIERYERRLDPHLAPGEGEASQNRRCDWVARRGAAPEAPRANRRRR